MSDLATDFETIKQVQRQIWSAGDFAKVATITTIVGGNARSPERGGKNDGSGSARALQYRCPGGLEAVAQGDLEWASAFSSASPPCAVAPRAKEKRGPG